MISPLLQTRPARKAQRARLAEAGLKTERETLAKSVASPNTGQIFPPIIDQLARYAGIRGRTWRRAR